MATDVSLATANSTYTSGSIKWSGLASGVDFSEVVDQLIELEQTSVTRLETWKQTWVDKNTSISTLQTRMVSVKLNARDLDSFSEFYTRKSASSNTSVLTTTNTSTAEVGTHTIEVGENIPGQIISTSYASTAGVGGAAGAAMTITVGSNTLTLTEGVDYLSTDTMDQLAVKIKTADNARAGGPILGDVYTINDKTRDTPAAGTLYKRLILTAAVPSGGPSEAISVSDPTDLSMDQNSVDAVWLKTWLFSSSDPASTGTYTGSTNKTFTLAAEKTGTLGVDDIKIHWADADGNSGNFTVAASDWTATKEYEIFQGVKVKFSAGEIARTESFTIDAFSPVYQKAQEKGLAQAEKEVHSGFSDLISAVHDGIDTGYFAYRYEGVLTQVAVDPGTTLQGLVNAINNDENNRGVTASIINDGQGTSASYHLVLTGKDTGAAHTIEIVDPATLSPALTGLNHFSVVGKFETAQDATDAMVKLDGYPSTEYKYVQRMTNAVSDLIGGVVIELKDVGESTVSVSNDTTTIKSKVDQFVQSINFVQDYIKDAMAYDSETKKSGVMIGNYTYDIVRNTLNDIMFSSIPGLKADEDTFTHLSQIGIKTNPDLDGEWMVDATALNEALNKDLEGVARLFVADPDHEGGASEGAASRVYQKLDALTNDTTGIAKVLTKNYNNIIADIDTKIAREEKRIALVKSRLEEKFARLETLLGQLSGQSNYLESQLANLPGVEK